jgi:hypothetical protein
MTFVKLYILILIKLYLCIIFNYNKIVIDFDLNEYTTIILHIINVIHSFIINIIPYARVLKLSIQQ